MKIGRLGVAYESLGGGGWLQDMVMINEDYGMKLMKIEEQRIGCGLVSYE
jgi:hypothetical protein